MTSKSVSKNSQN